MESASGALERFGPLLLAGHFAVTFGLTALMNYTLQAISDKTEAAPSWVAWIPIVQTHAFVRASGMTYTALLAWLLAGIGLAVVSGLLASGGGTPGPVILAIVGYGVAAFVWFAGVMWRLAERRGLSGWVGLGCLIPLVGLLFYFYLAIHDGFVRPSVAGLVIAAALSLFAVQGFRSDLAKLQEAGRPPAGSAQAPGGATPSGLGELFALLARSSEKPAPAPGSSPGEESSGGFLARWLGSGSPGEPRTPEIPDAVVCGGGTRLRGARPPAGTALWCEREGSGRKHGWYLAWYPDGSLREAGRYEDGLREGVWTRFWDSGGRKVQVPFEAGREHGLLVTWDELGRKQREIAYRHGEPGP